MSIVVKRADGRPVGEYVLAAWQRATAAPLPAFALLVRDSPQPSARTDLKRRLAVLCFELARDRKGRRFGLSQLDDAALLAVGQRTVSDWLRDLAALGLIARVHRGAAATGRASLYEWAYREPRTRGGRVATPPAAEVASASL